MGEEKQAAAIKHAAREQEASDEIICVIKIE